MLHGLEQVRLPDDIPELVARVYGDEEIALPAWRAYRLSVADGLSPLS